MLGRGILLREPTFLCRPSHGIPRCDLPSRRIYAFGIERRAFRGRVTAPRARSRSSISSMARHGRRDARAAIAIAASSNSCPPIPQLAASRARVQQLAANRLALSILRISRFSETEQEDSEGTLVRRDAKVDSLALTPLARHPPRSFALYARVRARVV